MENPQTVDELIEALSLKTFLKIHNTFDLWLAVPEVRKWRIEMDHVTYRGECRKNFAGDSLAALLKQAWFEIVRFEAMKAEAKNEL